MRAELPCQRDHRGQLSTHEFEVEGVRFELTSLTVDDACAGVDLLTSAEGMAKMCKLAKMFAGVAKVSRTPDGKFEIGGAMVAMKPFLEDVFRGRLDLLLAFVEQAVKAEYGSFLARAGVEIPSFTTTKA